MFLALKEIKHEKLRYGLVISMVVLISYLIFILTSLAQGLGSQNTAAIDTWNIKQVVLNKDSDINMRQSFLTTQQVDQLHQGKNDAVIGQAAVVATPTCRKSAQPLLESNQPNLFIKI